MQQYIVFPVCCFCNLTVTRAAPTWQTSREWCLRRAVRSGSTGRPGRPRRPVRAGRTERMSQCGGPCTAVAPWTSTLSVDPLAPKLSVPCLSPKLPRTLGPAAPAAAPLETQTVKETESALSRPGEVTATFWGTRPIRWGPWHISSRRFDSVCPTWRACKLYESLVKFLCYQTKLHLHNGNVALPHDNHDVIKHLFRCLQALQSLLAIKYSDPGSYSLVNSALCP